MFLQNIMKMVVGDNEKNLEKEKINLQNGELLNKETNDKGCNPDEQRKARRLWKIKISISVAVIAMILLVLVAIVVDITKKCTSEHNSTDCETPPNVMNSTNMVSGVQASYQCSDGFYPVGDTTIECQDGNWSAIEFSCSKYCDLPPDIPFSTHQTNGNTSGSNTSYHCQNGYVPVGEPNIVCNSNGEWSPVKLSCLKDCPKPPYVLSSTSWKSANKSGVYNTYRCDPGFYVVGEPSIVCQGGVWSTVKFSCSKYCGIPPDIPFSTHQKKGNISGSNTSYHCHNGYVPVGEPNIVCNSNGEWSPVKLSCLKDCPKPPDVLNSASWKSANKSGVFTSYRCHPGFYLVGQPSIVCQDGVWSSVKLTCSKYCGSPPILPFSTSRMGGNKFGAITSYECRSGFIPVGDMNIFCNSDGEWSTPQMSCLKDCGSPPSIYLAKAYYDTSYSGSKAFYSCKSGYLHVGYPTATCQSNGFWTMNSFYCKLPEKAHTSRANAVILSIRSWSFTLVIGIMLKALFVSI